jgi:ActR/RegA family two-component response regulator
MTGTPEEAFNVVRSEIILVAAPDAGFRRSLAFALESDGFRVDAHPGAVEAFASRHARGAACAVIDDDAVADWRLAPEQFGRFARPVILLVGFFHTAPALPFTRIVTKPFLGAPLIEAVREAIGGAV